MRQKRTARASSVEQEIDRYLRTGEYDHEYSAWPGWSLFDRAKLGGAELNQALVAEVRLRERGHQHPALPAGLDLKTFTRQKQEPMVNGLFPRAERETMLGVLDRSVRFLTQDTIGPLIADCDWHHTAWTLANIYLYSIGAELLSEDDWAPLGMSEETTCYVSMAYFEEDYPFADYVVHEAAHVFHNCKREMIGLRHTWYREWLLPIDFHKRETFAYACEVYSRIMEQSRRVAQRRKLFAEYAEDPLSGDETVDADELLDIIAEAVEARNGWKRILGRCSRPLRRR